MNARKIVEELTTENMFTTSGWDFTTLPVDLCPVDSFSGVIPIFKSKLLWPSKHEILCSYFTIVALKVSRLRDDSGKKPISVPCHLLGSYQFFTSPRISICDILQTTGNLVSYILENENVENYWSSQMKDDFEQIKVISNEKFECNFI